MSTEVSASWSSGSTSDKHQESCVGVAGTGLPSAFYATSGDLIARLNDDGSIDIKETSLLIQQYGISNANPSTGGWASTDPWYFHGLYISTTSFTLTDGPSGPGGYGNGVKVWSDGTIWHDKSGTPSSHYSKLTDGESTGWQRIANSINDVEHNQDNTIIYLYAGGLIDYNESPTSSISITSVKIALTAEDPGFTQFFEYFPWQRKINGIWMSLNRNGVNSTTGLYRMKNMSYKPCTNIQEDSNKSHGFTYNNGWQVSPKSGQGA